ncbi:MAG: type II toxin-antitoxin system RelE/ParE family toxin [Thermoanaerobaculia bacterium]
MAAPRKAKPPPVTVVYDPEAVLDLEQVKGKDERKALFNAVDKLRRLGAQLAPPHVKLLKGEADLYELRPRQGRSAVRPLYGRFGDLFVILAIATKRDFDRKVRLAGERAAQYDD